MTMENLLNDWVEDSAMECAHGCGTTLELVKRDYLFTGPNKQKVIGENIELLECSECGDLSIPSHTAKVIEEYFKGNVEPSRITEVPTLQIKSA